MQRTLQSTASPATVAPVGFDGTGDAMFTAFMLTGVGSATVNIYGVAAYNQPASTHKLLGTLSPTGTTQDAFKISGEFYAAVYSAVTVVNGGGTVNVVMGA